MNLKYYGERLKGRKLEGDRTEKRLQTFKSSGLSKLVSYINLTSTEAIHREWQPRNKS